MPDEIKSCEKCEQSEPHEAISVYPGEGRCYHCKVMGCLVPKLLDTWLPIICRCYSAPKPKPTAFEEWWGAVQTMFDLSDPTVVAKHSAGWALAEVERWQDEVYKPNAPDLNTKLAELRKGL